LDPPYFHHSVVLTLGSGIDQQDVPAHARMKLLQNGRAMVKVIEGLYFLKTTSGSWRESVLINLTLSLYQHRLRQAVKILPASLTAEIFSASETLGRQEQ
jgi:hypothetical protein